MTYCEKIGLKVGDKIRVLRDHLKFRCGSIIELCCDYITDTSEFIDEYGKKAFFDLNKDGGEGSAWERVDSDYKDGWVARVGNGCPVDGECKVDVKVRSGLVWKNVAANSCEWMRRGDDLDIVAYRISKPDYESLTDQLTKAVAKRDKQATKAKNHAEKLDQREAEVQRLIRELEREIEDSTGLVVYISDKKDRPECGINNVKVEHTAKKINKTTEDR